MQRITLGENDIETLINGGSIQRQMPDGAALVISQNLLKDISAPLINHDKKIYSDGEIANIKIAASAMPSAMRMGV